MQIGVDIGGTFTDIVALHRDGRLTLAKAILRLKVDVVEIRSPDQLERAIAGIAGQGTAAVVAADPNVLNQARRIQALLLKHRIPARTQKLAGFKPAR